MNFMKTAHLAQTPMHTCSQDAALAWALSPATGRIGPWRWPLSWPSSGNCYKQKSFSSHTSNSQLPDCGFCKNLPRKRLRLSLGIHSPAGGLRSWWKAESWAKVASPQAPSSPTLQGTTLSNLHNWCHSWWIISIPACLRVHDLWPPAN